MVEMSLYGCLTCLLVVFPGTAGAACTATTPVDPTLKCVFEDGFDRTALDQSEWTYRLTQSAKHRSCQRAENVSVFGGMLHIAKRRETVVCDDGVTKLYTGGGVISRRSWVYGYFEARLKLGTAVSWHPAFWTMCSDSALCRSLPSGLREIDVLEYDDGYNDGVLESNMYGAGIHLNPDPDWPWEPVFVRADIGTEWHVYGAHHVPGRVTFYFDGVVVKVADYDGDPGLHNLWLSVLSLVEKPFMYNEDLPDEFRADWIRVYQ